MLSNVRDDPQVASENRPVGAGNEPTEERDRRTEKVPSDATKTDGGPSITFLRKWRKKPQEGKG